MEKTLAAAARDDVYLEVQTLAGLLIDVDGTIVVSTEARVKHWHECGPRQRWVPSEQAGADWIVDDLRNITAQPGRGGLGDVDLTIHSSTRSRSRSSTWLQHPRWPPPHRAHGSGPD